MFKIEPFAFTFAAVAAVWTTGVLSMSVAASVAPLFGLAAGYHVYRRLEGSMPLAAAA